MKNISMAAIVCFLSLSLLGQDIEVTCDQWKADIAFYKSKLKERHANLYHTISPNQFNAKIGELEKNVCSLEDQQVIVGLSEITASIRDGHTYLHPGNQRKWKFKQMPVRLELFDDGLFVIAADEANKNLIGKKLTAIDSTPVEKITPKIRMIGYRENESTAKLSIPRFIIYPEVLKYFGFIESGETINASFASKAGVLEKRLLIPQIASKIKWVGFTESQTDLPLVYRRNKEIYWFELLPEKELLYLQFNSHSEDKNHQFARLTSELISKIDSQKPKKFVIDLRRNLGGNSSLTFPIISVLSHFERTVPDGQIFIIISRATYSASLVFLSEAKRFADPLLLGEPTGVAPNLYTENGYLLTLPNSKVEVSYSSMFFQFYNFLFHNVLQFHSQNYQSYFLA